MFFDHRMFAAQEAAFADRYRTIRYDLRGQGRARFCGPPRRAWNHRPV
jgi:pimeloyl-ACP methyl ester carboxylesterase